MNTVDNIMALKGATEGQPGNFVQVFNLDTKAPMPLLSACVEQLADHSVRHVEQRTHSVAPQVSAV